MNVGLNLNPEVRARGTVVFDASTIDRRLIYLASKPQTAEIEAEIDYLKKLMARKFPNYTGT